MSQDSHRLMKKWKLGTLFYKFYYAPKSSVQKILNKGVINSWLDYRCQQQMEQATYRLKTVETRSEDNFLDIHFLTGKKYWYQTIFCAYSFAQHTNESIRPIVYDDGSLEKTYQEEILRIFPFAKIVLHSEIEEYINDFLPEGKYPCLRKRRKLQPHMRKIIDIRIISSGWNLVLDSDMLFFRNPSFLIDWLKNPQSPCYMVDVEESYGYSKALIASLAQAKIPDRVNVGICGLNSDDIDWEELEYWAKTLIDSEGTTYYMDQALSAMLMAGKSCKISPASDYIVMPNQEEVIQPKAVLHHYVDKSKPWYFRYGWKHILNYH
jgi:hypothetical protein